MSGYKIYLENSEAQIPRTTRYNRHDEREPKNSSDSSEDDKYRELANQSSSAEDEVSSDDQDRFPSSPLDSLSEHNNESSSGSFPEQVPNASSPIMHHVNDSFELPDAENEFFIT